MAPSPASASRAATLPLRLAAIVYDGLLLFGVVFVVGYALLLGTGWSYPLTLAQRATLQALLFAAIGTYFVVSWARTGQTLALRTWRLRVVDDGGQPPTTGRAIARYVAAWHLWLPGIAAASLVDLGVGARLAALLAGFALMLAPALFDRDRRLLHDRITATRVVRISETDQGRRQTAAG